MKIYLYLLIYFSTVLSLETKASSVSLDVGQTKTVFNNISIPRSEDDQLSLPNDETITSYRLTGFFDLSNDNQFYFLLAPLQVAYEFESEKDFTFADTDFETDTDTTLNYKFNSYRLGYLWTWKANSLRYWSGFVGKIRDANTEVVQGSEKDNFSNVGFVPLLALGFEWSLTDQLSLFSHTDALGSNQGSAYDSNLELKWSFGVLGLSIGRRILGGGADNERVFNFAQFDTNYLRLSFLY